MHWPLLPSGIYTVQFAYSSLWLNCSPATSSGQRNAFAMYLRCYSGPCSPASAPRYSQSILTPLYLSIAFFADIVLAHSDVVSYQLHWSLLPSEVCTIHFAYTYLGLDRSPATSSGQRNGFAMYLRCCSAPCSPASAPRYSQSILAPSTTGNPPMILGSIAKR